MVTTVEEVIEEEEEKKLTRGEINRLTDEKYPLMKFLDRPHMREENLQKQIEQSMKEDLLKRQRVENEV